MNIFYSVAFFSFIFSINSASANTFSCFATPPETEDTNTQAVLFSTNNDLTLTEKIANYLGVSLGSIQRQKFGDGEMQIRIEESVKGKNVLILQPDCVPLKQITNDGLMDLYLLVRTMKKASAASITAIIPYYGHSRKAFRKFPVSATDVALFLEIAGVDRVVTVDLYGGQIQGFFRNIPVDNLYATSLFIPYFASKELSNIVVVAPDLEGADKAKKFSEGLEKYGIPSDVAIIETNTQSSELIDCVSVIGNVRDADVILIDDVCHSSCSLVKMACLLQEQGANRVFAVVAHPIFSSAALEEIGNSVIEEMVIADTVPLKETPPKNIRSIQITPLLGSAIQKTPVRESLMDLFP